MKKVNKFIFSRFFPVSTCTEVFHCLSTQSLAAQIGNMKDLVVGSRESQLLVHA